MLKSKEEYLENLDSLYRRIVISSGNFATKAFEKILNEEPKEDWKIRTYDFIKKYQDSSLFINCESLLSDYDVKIFLSIVLSALTDNETEFYLYLFAPENEIAALREKLEVVYNYKKDWITYIRFF